MGAHGQRTRGLDPLADRYLELGAKHHNMRYVASPAERMPFEAGYFDIVCSFNSLDHVDNLRKTIKQIKGLLDLVVWSSFLLIYIRSRHRKNR